MNKLFVAYKPPYMTSTKFLFNIKKKYKSKNCGFSGTLDPFAKGSMVIAFGQYTKLFRFFKKTKKTYRATIWLGAQSKSFDIENITDIEIAKPIDTLTIQNELQNLVGTIEYIPPKFSAKWIDGRRAYELARRGCEFDIPKATMEIFDIRFLHYQHPFITFETTVSEGAYIRSLAQILLERLGAIGTLSFLERTGEGDFVYEHEKALNPLDFIDLQQNFYRGNLDDFINGKKMTKEDFEIQNNGIYYIIQGDYFTIMELTDQKARYIVNRVALHGN